jgi:hypothetical protein
MKNLFLSLVLVMISLVANSQLPSHLNLQEIQKEFMILYYKRCDSLGHKIVEDKSLVCLTECQVNYLSKLEDISHEQEVGSKFYSLVDRYAFFYPQMSKTSGVNLEMSEVISLAGVGKTLNKQTNKGLAKRLFNNFLKSDSHREIMDDKKLIKVNFQVGLNKCNSIYIVGVLSNQTLK